MIIYEFSTWFATKDKPYTVKEIEVEEKTKIYMGRGTRINKDEIDKFGGFGNRMYRLDNDPKPYIAAMIDRCKKNVEAKKLQLKSAETTLAEWEAEAERNKQ